MALCVNNVHCSLNILLLNREGNCNSGFIWFLDCIDPGLIWEHFISYQAVNTIHCGISYFSSLFGHIICDFLLVFTSLCPLLFYFCQFFPPLCCQICSHIFKHILVFEAVGSGKGRVCSCKYTNLLLFVFLSSCLLPSIFHIFKHILEFEAVGRGMGRVCRRHSPYKRVTNPTGRLPCLQGGV